MQQELPRISVFMPTYNHARFIGAALDSVIAQDYPNLQIVVGDDGSTDGTADIVREYERVYPELIKFVASSVNTGITANCNRTLAACDGELLALFSGDDLWLPDKLHKQVQLLAQNPEAVLCYTLVEVFDSESGRVTRIEPDLRLGLDAMDPIELSYWLGSAGISFLLRRSAAPSSFESSIGKFSDWLFWIDVLSNGTAVRIDDVLAKYRRHGANASNDFDTMLHDHLAVLAIAERRHPEFNGPIAKRRRYFQERYIRDVLGQSGSDDLVASVIEFAGLRRTARALVWACIAKLRS